MSQFAVIVRLCNGINLETLKYNNKEHAIRKLEEFGHRSSIEYRFVALLDLNTNTVCRLLYFEGGIVMADVIDGDIVKLKEGYYSRGEEKYLYLVSDLNENNGRCLIKCINSGNIIPSTESVEIKMIEVVSHRN